jgi:SAM-dependent methyltransferase
MTKNQFTQVGVEISQRISEIDSMHGYFTQAIPRLYLSCKQFGLFSEPLGDVLELGPFYGYLPFILKERASSYTVLEGDDPAVYPLIPFYKEEGIQFDFIDFFDLFGPVKDASHSLPYPDNAFDTLICWETMEHFNFNPTKFVRELFRVLKPGGRAFITVPNRASFQAFVGLIFGRGELESIDHYFQFEDYESGGKNVFYGFHWREYTAPELNSLFAKSGFEVQFSRSVCVFHDHHKPNLARRGLRLMSTVGTMALPRFGTNIFLAAKKN